MRSCIYRGRVKHRRTEPVSNEFEYRLFMLYLDLDELETVFRGRWLWSTTRPNFAWFRRRDHLGEPDRPLSECVRDLVKDKVGRRPTGPIGLLTHLRYLGFGFNPVSFFYCYEDDGVTLDAIVSEVNNTPWLEQYCYVHDAKNDGSEIRNFYKFDLRKSFHVSPVMSMDVDYRWRFSRPNDTLFVHMRNTVQGKGIFDASLHMDKVPISSRNLAKMLTLHPAMTLKVVAAIYYQAVKLWKKGAPFYNHPGKLDSETQPAGLIHENSQRNRAQPTQ